MSESDYNRLEREAAGKEHSPDKSVTQVGSAFHRAAEILSRIRFLDDRPELKKENPEAYNSTYDQLCEEFKNVFSQGTSNSGWFWYGQNSGNLDR